MVYHISKDGVARLCQAKDPEGCRATPFDHKEHYQTREEAQQAYEEQHETVKSLKKSHEEFAEATKEEIRKKREEKFAAVMMNYDFDMNAGSYDEPLEVKPEEKNTGYKTLVGMSFKEVEYSPKEKERAVALQEYINEYTTGKVGRQIPRFMQQMMIDHINETSHTEYENRGIEPDKLINLIRHTQSNHISAKNHEQVMKQLFFMNDLNNDVINGIELGSNHRAKIKVHADNILKKERQKEAQRKHSLFGRFFRSDSKER